MKNIVSSRFRASPCPICGRKAKINYDHQDGEIYRCQKCCHSFYDVRRVKFETYSKGYFKNKHKNWFQNPNVCLFQALHRIIKQNKGSRVLDVGCGNGDLLLFLRKNDPSLQLIGVDKAMKKRIKGITILREDVEKVKIKRKMDVVISLAVIEHVKNPLVFLNKLKKLTKVNGQIIIMTLNEGGIIYQLARKLKSWGVGFAFDRLYSSHHLNHFSRNSLHKLLGKAGIAIEESFTHNFPKAAVDFESRGVVADFLIRNVVFILFLAGQIFQLSFLQTVVGRNKP
jgi:2-polyprenyl-3-methyl-5-hydroxy-6-metoxy-1,4-benzoquinol methylase